MLNDPWWTPTTHYAADFYICKPLPVTWYCSVSEVTRLQAAWLRNRVLMTCRGKRFSSAVKWWDKPCGTPSFPFTVEIRVSSPEAKQPGCKVNHSHPSSAEVSICGVLAPLWHKPSRCGAQSNLGTLSLQFIGYVWKQAGACEHVCVF
jgi:hypothetical protein